MHHHLLPYPLTMFISYYLDEGSSGF